MKRNNFKNYLYLNMDFLNSYTSQIDKKLESLKLNMSDDINLNLSQVSKHTKEILALRESENMLNHFIKHINLISINAKCICEETACVCIRELSSEHLNEYIKLETYYDYINLSRLETISDPAMRDFYSTISRYNQFSSESKDLFSVDYIAEINQKLPIMKKLFPFDTFLYAKETIVLINNDYLCENQSQIGYKFNNNYTVVGKVEKIATNERPKSMKPNKMLDGVQIAMLSVLRELGFISSEDKNIYLINPIAIYNEVNLKDSYL